MRSGRNPRLAFLLIFLLAAALLGFGLYLQHVKNLEPCPLCIMQRYAFVLVAAVALVASLHGRTHKVYAFFVLLAAAAGIATAGRHVWLEHLPKEKLPACGPGLDYLLDAFPLSKALPMIFKGSGECAEVGWRFLGLSISEWALAWFAAFAIAALALLFARPGVRPAAPRT